MQNFSAEVGQLHRFLIGHRLQQTRIRDLTRVTGINAVNVGPDLAAVGAQAGGQHRGGVIRAITAQHHQLTFFVTRGEARHQHHMVRRDLAGGNAASRLSDINGGFEVMANGQQFFNRVNHRDVMTARFQQAGHNGDRELFSPANKGRVNAIRALPKQANAVQDVFDLCEFLLNKSFQLRERKTRLCIGETLQKFGENAFGIGDIGQRILPANGFFDHGNQVISDLRRGRQYGRYLPLPGITLQNIGNAQKTFCICH